MKISTPIKRKKKGIASAIRFGIGLRITRAGRSRAEVNRPRRENSHAGSRRLDLETVAHDPRVLHQPLDAGTVESRHPARIESRKRLPIRLALAQDGAPRQPGLRALERDELEELPVVVHP